MNLKVLNFLRIYELDGKEIVGGTDKEIAIEAHWNRVALVAGFFML